MSACGSFRTLLATLLLIATVLAGCLGGDASNDAGDEAPQEGPPEIIPGTSYTQISENPIPDGPDHDHDDPAQHQVSINIEPLGMLGRGEIGNAFGELDIVGDRAYQCVLGDGFRIIDLSNRSDPVQISHYPGTACADIKVTDDNTLAVVSGSMLFDVSDPTDPHLIHEYPRACHMCFIHEIDGEEYVFLAQSLRGSPPEDLPNQGYVEIARIVRGDTLGESTMEPVAVYKMDPATAPNTHLWDAPTYTFSIHDMFVYDDPVDDRPIMLVAHWDMGIRMVDVSDPAQPREFAKWDDFMGDCGDIHTVHVDFIDDRRILAAATENGIIIDPLCSANRWSWGFVYILDATDWDDVRTLGKWHAPGVQPSEPMPRSDRVPPEVVGIFSAHNIQFVEGRIYHAMYHGGVWVLDIAPFVQSGGASLQEILLRTDHVPTVGVHFPTCEGGGPNVWDVGVSHGYLYASDMDCGLEVLHFIGDDLNDPARTGSA